MRRTNPDAELLAPRIRRVSAAPANVARQTWIAGALLGVARFLDRWLVATGLLSATRLLRWRVTPAKLRRRALRLAGLKTERYHLPIPLIDARLRAAVDACARADDALAGCARGGRDLRLGVVGVFVLERRLTRQLVADLHVTAARAAEPRVDAAPAGSPLVIVGPPRSGTTLLLELLACDGDTWRELTAADATIPCVVGDDRVASRVSTLAEALLAGQQYAFDRTRDAHYECWDGATECRTALENGCGAPYVLWWVFGLTDRLDAWLDDDADRDGDYAFYKAQLDVVKWVSGGDARDWLLKDPAHLFSLPSLFKAFPNAKVVWLHREPAAAAASLCSLVSSLWTIVHRVDGPRGPMRFRGRVVEYLGRMLDRGLAFRAARPAAAIHDLRMSDLVADPIASARAIYAFAGKDLSDDAAAKMEAYLETNRRERRAGRHGYDGRDFGLDGAELDARFAAYRARFGV